MALAQVKDDLSKYLRQAAEEEVIITRHGRPAGVLIGFASDDDWFEYRLEHHPKFLLRVQEVRAQNAKGGARGNQFGVSLGDIRVLANKIRTNHESADVDPEVQWTMNNTLVVIGIHFPKHRERPSAIGETLGVYRD